MCVIGYVYRIISLNCLNDLEHVCTVDTNMITNLQHILSMYLVLE
jgi:hypothetical protein